ncbi:MAG: hypothetical protein J0L63_20890, partial [Anaerolineae bacterium]|nr:hypothetical protein [Anaerolineae bacterium]
GGDALCTALDEGWQIEDVVGYEEYEHIGARGTCVYYFELKRGDEQMTMPVIGNPYVGRLVSIMAFKLVPVTARAR